MEKEILNTFLYDEKLKFSDIEKRLKTRSNKLAYHIKNLVKKNAITKDKDTYKLSESHEHLIPYLSEKTSPLPVVLIHVGNKTKCFLHKRKKRPFLNMLSLPGGRLTVGESIEEASTRIMKGIDDSTKLLIVLTPSDSLLVSKIPMSSSILVSV